MDRCDPGGCAGAPCHWQCAVSTDPKSQCGCHCKGRFHGVAAPDPPTGTLRERIAHAKANWRAGRDAKALRSYDDEALAASLNKAFAADDKKAIRALSREAERRDRADQRAISRAEAKQRTAARRNADTLEHHTRAEAAYRVAEDETNGHMLSRAGQAKNIDPKALWSMPEARARKYASEELNEHWDKHGRLTVAASKAEARRSRQAEEEAHEAEFGPYSHLTYARMRRQDFDSSVPLSLMDDSTVRAAQPHKAKADAMGTEDMFG